MTSVLSQLQSSPLLVWAAEETGTTTEKFQYDLPKTFEQWLLLVVVGVALAAYIIWMYVRDTRSMHWFWRGWLTLLRLAVVAGLAVIFLNPHIRSQETVYRPSQVAIVLDKSLSSRFPAEDRTDAGTLPPGAEVSRADAMAKLMADTDLLKKLSETHQVKFYTFGQHLEPGRPDLQAQNDPIIQKKLAEEANQKQSNKPATDEKKVDHESVAYWKDALKPTDQVTRLGESMLELMRKVRGDTVSGIVVVTDGGLNAGPGYESIIQAAKDAGGRKGANLKIYTVGVGSTKPQPNLRIANLEAPTQVHTKDKFEIITRLQGQNLEGKEVEVILKAQYDEGGSLSTPREVARKTITLGKDGVAEKVSFEQAFDETANLRYTVEANLLDPVAELKQDDNVKSANVAISDQKTRVLMVAGGPMRDYRFLTNIVSRNPSFRGRAFLQTVDPATFESVSQNVELVSEFPATMEELNGSADANDDTKGYDVIVFFDPDWKSLNDLQPDAIPLLKRWVSEFSGGCIFVAGDVYTPDLAAAGDAGDSLEPVHTLYPVFLSASSFFDLQLDNDSDQAWHVKMTDAGYAASFLQVTDKPSENRDFWDEEFEGFYRCYPTTGAKSGATVYATFPDTRMADGSGTPILIAEQMYGSGKTLYLGSGETWRLRAISNTYHERLWTKLIREVGEGRRSKGRSPVSLAVEKEVKLGTNVRVEAEVLDATFQPTEYDSVKVQLMNPRGEVVFPEPQLFRDKNRPGEYVGNFRATELGWYTLKLPIPGTESYREEAVQVVFPGLEDVDTEQAVAKLADLSRQTGGRYIPISEAATELPKLLQDKHKIVPVDQRIQTLWDRDWVLYALVAVLSVEWLTRKLLKLA